MSTRNLCPHEKAIADNQFSITSPQKGGCSQCSIRKKGFAYPCQGGGLTNYFKKRDQQVETLPS